MDVEIEVHNRSDRAVTGSHGSQWLFCLLAGDAHDRILTDPAGAEHRLDTLGDVVGSKVSLRDGWLELDAQLASDGAQRVLWQGIRTVNQSVGGYETVYQGTSVLVLRTVEIPAGGKLAWTLRLDLTQSKADRPL